MALQVKRVDVWAASIEDRPGGLARKLAALTEAGANLEFVIARRAPEKPGTGVIFLTPLRGTAQLKAAKLTGFRRTPSLHSVRVSGPDRPGIGAKITRELAAAGINLRGLSAAAIGNRFVAHLAVDSAAAATRAIRVLKKMK